MYIACLLYADADYGMAQLITDLYKAVYKDMTFFNPQLDMKTGKYIYDTIARVIDERCDGKVVFLLSQYFLASDVCQFAVNFAASQKGTGNGNLIPFNLTRDVEHVPKVLNGITGIRWFRTGTREHAWSVLTDCLLGQKKGMSPEKLEELKEHTNQLVNANRSLYLCDPPYDDDEQPPGIPIEVKSPSITLPISSSESLPSPIPSSESEKPEGNNGKRSFLKVAKNYLFGKVLKQPSRKYEQSGQCKKISEPKTNVTNQSTTENKSRFYDQPQSDTGSNDAHEMVTISTSGRTVPCENDTKPIDTVCKIIETDTPAIIANIETNEDATESDVLMPTDESS